MHPESLDDLLNLLNTRGAKLRGILEKTPRLEMLDAYRGTLSAGRSRARVLLATDRRLEVSMAVQRPVAAPAALEFNSELAGNLRYARASGGLELRAESMIDGETDAAQSLAGLADSLTRANGGKKKRTARRGRKIEAAAVDSALTEIEWHGESLVRLDEGWEVRPRIVGTAVPVRVLLEEAQLRLRSCVLKKLPSGRALEALAELGLRLNRRIRFARLSSSGGMLHVESFLDSGLIHPAGLSMSCRAVATAFLETRQPLRLLAEQELVALCYAEMFITPSQPQKNSGQARKKKGKQYP